MSQRDAASARRRLPLAQIVIVMMVAAMLTGCGKKGNPVPPPGQPNTYPRTYPAQ